MKQNGFTYVEFILYIAIVIIVITTLIPFAWNVIEGGAKSTTEQEVFSNAMYISELLKYKIRSATSINSLSSTQISLAIASTSASPIVIRLSNGNLTLAEGSASAVQLNTRDTIIRDLTFTNYSSSDAKARNIQFSFTVSASYSGTRSEFVESARIDADAELRGF